MSVRARRGEVPSLRGGGPGVGEQPLSLRPFGHRLSDAQPAVRAKAVRSLGKLVRAAYLSPAQEERVRLAILRVLGRDEAHEWDRAFIVRREAEEALRHLEDRT